MPEEAVENPLILVPHSDDEWIGPYAILKNSRENSICIYFNLFGNDYSEHNKQIRNSEIERSSQFWGFRLNNNSNFDSDSLSQHLKNHTYIFVPTPYDWHPEHRKVFQTFVEAMNKLSIDDAASKHIYYYCVSVPHSVGEYVHYIQMSKNDVDNKWKDFSKIYHSQSFMPSLRYKLNLRLVPSKCGYAAQFYIPVNYVRLKTDYNLSLRQDFVEYANSLIHKINNLYKIRGVKY